ncbi:MAG: hypothetical protein K2O35_03010, partial [Clostridia bacterium]|nr:hypothetical protein [Clostridia bacterium]
MQALKKRKSIKYIMISIALLLCLTIAVISGAQSLDSAPNAVVMPTASATLNATYGALYHGSTYRYTDYTKVEDMHSGAITDDTTVITVDSSQPHGSQQNPFVIDSTAKWNAFVADMNNTSSGITDYGAGDYFVLAKDLDFNGVTFSAVPYFEGTFYGLDHTISNIVCSFANDSNGGLFMNVSNVNAILADITVKDANFSSIKNTCAFICGNSGGSKILNCHANGIITRGTAISTEVCVGGILGKTSGTSDTLLYRCSSDYTTTLKINNTSNGSKAGAILGEALNTGKVEILDSYAKYVSNINSTHSNSYSGFIAASTGQPAASTIRIEGCVSYSFQQNANQLVNDPMLTTVMSFWSTKISSLTVKDSYFGGGASKSGSTFSVYPTNYHTNQASNFNNTTLDVSNLNWYADSTLRYNASTHRDLLTSKVAANMIRHSSAEADLWAAAQADTALYDKIWTNKNAIGGTYTVENSPVRNTSFVKEQFDVEFYNYKNNSDESIGVTT